MRTEDIAEVHRCGISESYFSVNDQSQGFWTREQLKAWTDSNDILLVAEDKGKIVGYVTSQFHQPTGKAIIENLYVAKDYRRRSIGADLIKECTERLKRKEATHICALVEPDNKTTIRLLESQEFGKGKTFIWMSK